MRSRESRSLKIFTALAVAIVVALLSYNTWRSSARAEVLSQLLAISISDDRDSQIAALATASRYFLDDKLPADIYLRFIDQARVSELDDVKRAARDNLWQVSQETGHKADLEAALARRPPFIDVRSASGADSARAKLLVDRLKHEASANGPLLVGFSRYEIVPGKPEIRCFAKDCERGGLIREVSDFLGNRGLGATPEDKSSSIRQTTLYTNVIEVWVPGDKLRADTPVTSDPKGGGPRKPRTRRRA